MTQQDVTILGAGLVGICTALSLAERGVRVTVIDRGAPGQETSHGNAGVISPWSIIPQALPGLLPQLPRLLFGRHRPLAVRPGFWPRMVPWGLRFLAQGREPLVRRAADAMEVLCSPSITLYRRHLNGTGHEGLVRDSLYVHAFRDASRASLDAIDYRIRQEKGAELALVGADALRRLEPALSRDFKAAVLIKGQARAVSPGRIGTVLAQKAAGLGVRFRQAEVTGLRRADDGWIIATDAGDLPAQQVVIAMGVWSKALLDPLGLALPLVAERGYHLEFADPGISLENSVMDMDAKVVASSMEDGLRIAGHAEFGSPDAPPIRAAKQGFGRRPGRPFPA